MHIPIQRRYALLLCLFSLCPSTFAQRLAEFPSLRSDQKLKADLYGEGNKAVILAHGGRFDKESWKIEGEALARAGFLVLAIQFRGDALNPDGTPSSEGSNQENADDILAAAAYLRRVGAKSVSAIGASLGGDAVGDADAESAVGAFDRIVILSSSGGGTPDKLKGRKLYVTAQDDASASGLRLPEISQNYALVPEPKRIVFLNGSAHAQFIFNTDQGPLLLKAILQFLEEP